MWINLYCLIISQILFVYSVVLAEANSRTDDTEFVIHGKTAKIKNFPFMAGIFYDKSFTCGGSILNKNWILTAAHCAYDSASGAKRTPSKFTVLVASDDLKRGQQLSVSNVVVHPKFKINSYADDVALIKVKQPLSYGSTIQPTQLPIKLSGVPEGTTATLLGWGYAKNNEGHPEEFLKKTDLKIYSQPNCVSAYSKIRPILPSELCAMYPGGGRGQCTGDSGGPLIVEGTKGKYQAGIVSFSEKPCANKNFPGVYVRLSYYVDWIYSVI